MIVIYDITNNSIDYTFLMAALVFLLMGLGFYLEGTIKPTKKRLETPFEKIDNLIQLENKRIEYKKFTNAGMAFCFAIGMIIIVASLKPFISSIYKSKLKQNSILTGRVENFSINDFKGVQMVYFKIETQEFSFFMDKKYISKRYLENGDLIIISYIKPKLNSGDLNKITKIELITRPDNSRSK